MRMYWLLLPIILLPSISHSASLGTCRKTSERYAKHIYFLIEKGRKLLVDARKYRATQKLLESEKQLLRLEKKDHMLSRNRIANCQDTVKRLEKLSQVAEKTIRGLKKEYDKLKKAFEQTLVKVQKLQVQNKRLKKQRWVWALRAAGTVFLLAGAAVIALESYQAVSSVRSLGLPMLTAGVGSATVGTGILVFSFAVD